MMDAGPFFSPTFSDYFSLTPLSRCVPFFHAALLSLPPPSFRHLSFPPPCPGGRFFFFSVSGSQPMFTDNAWCFLFFKQSRAGPVHTGLPPLSFAARPPLTWRQVLCDFFPEDSSFFSFRAHFFITPGSPSLLPPPPVFHPFAT